MLGVIPDDRAVAVRPAIPDGSGWAASFGRLRARLRYFDVDRELRVIAITSAAPGEGKTTVAYNLAVAATRAGTATLLIEADLRRPVLAGRLGLAADPGLGTVLARGCSTEEAVQGMALRVDGVGHIGGLLDLIPAGSVIPPNPDELLESRAMAALLARAREHYTLVVIDTPALGAVTDALPLLAGADGVLVVGAIGHTRADLGAVVRETLVGIGAPVLGVVANRVRHRSGTGYGPLSTSATPTTRPELRLTTLNGDGPAVRAAMAADAADESWQ